ncbi:MAG: 7-cyano-7-deazaguanine synthase [Candidatus Omnitrophica bacterium CG11_big_fil_rev_8_21_14_0_20_63_9]|nr:MAG: 7-cyano-7-deazaguanine synthase [Candidatus Omnitrophica bacterium CG11_big_fil_rev_8_21_14_0_20_63_9]
MLRSVYSFLMPPSRSTIGVLISGGVDSAVLLDRLLRQGCRVQPIYVRCGFRWEAAELRHLRRLLHALHRKALKRLMILDVPLRSAYGPHWSFGGARVPGARSTDAAVYLPGRNALLLSHAAVACAQRGIDHLALGILKSNPFGDASPQFLRQMASALTLALGRRVRILTPLRQMSKARVIQSGRGVPLALTFSCINPRGDRHCGMCNKCAERQRAFRQTGLRPS